LKILDKIDYKEEGKSKRIYLQKIVEVKIPVKCQATQELTLWNKHIKWFTILGVLALGFVIYRRGPSR